MKSMVLKKILLCSCAILLSIDFGYSQNANESSIPAGNWVASCDGAKLKIDSGYEIALITIDTAYYDPGYFSSEFYFAVDFVANGEHSEFDCASEEQVWEDWAINLYFSFSYSGSYSQDHLTFDAGDGYSVQNSYQLKPEFIKIKADYELISSDQLKIAIDGKEYEFYRMNEKH